MADSQELDLIVKLRNPNTRNQAFSVLVNTHQERLYWHIRRMVVGHDDTDDILQNTFIKAFRALDTFGARVSSTRGCTALRPTKLSRS
jgi:DNA-directed RNA polymerase specialized sigma24 family protein